MDKSINIMEKSIHDDLIELNISDLLSCLEVNQVKEQFIHENGKVYNSILKLLSTVKNMRDFHNWIKLVLITNITDYYYQSVHSEIVSLLDISTGRGGDIMKWNRAYITHVFGFDVSDKSINSVDAEDPGAKERLKNLKNIKTKIEFEIGDATRPEGDTRTDTPEVKSKITKFLNVNKLGKQFDLVSCQFALHYYFSSEIALRNVLNLVSTFLKPGGYFFGTTVDGAKIKSYFDYIDHNVFQRSLYKIEKFFPNKIVSPFGNKYTFTIYDSFDKTNYFNTMGVSTEYLVDFNVLNRIAKEYSLEPVNINFFEKHQNKYTSSSNVIPFEEIYTMGKWKSKLGQITPEELELSFLNSVFMFKKV
jgi:mRNA (guanine-N7-)-methyltransferase